MLVSAWFSSLATLTQNPVGTYVPLGSCLGRFAARPLSGDVCRPTNGIIPYCMLCVACDRNFTRVILDAEVCCQSESRVND